MKKGTQIIYVPDHARGDTTHPDCEEGFITGPPKSEMHQGNAYLCRYFNMLQCNELRTKKNSELTFTRNIVAQNHREQRIIDKLLSQIEQTQ